MPYKKQTDYPFKKARLVNCDGDLTKRWYVVYYAWNLTEEKLQRKRIYINEYKTARERTDAAKKIIDEINQELIGGAVIRNEAENEENPEILTADLTSFNVLNALQYAYDLKTDTARGSTKSTYGSVWKVFKEWLIKTGTASLNIQQIEGKHLHKFFDYLKKEYRIKKGETERKVEAGTYNNYKQHITTFFNVLVDREVIRNNPVHVVKKMQAEETRNVAFVGQQKELLKEQIPAINPELWQFVQIIYYTLMRPGELLKLRVKNVDLQNERFFIPASISKTGIARYPKITPGLRKVIESMSLKDFNPEDLLFTKLGTPGPDRLKRGENHYTRKHRAILDKLGFGSEYVLYSWKHTGAVDLYRAGVKEQYIMKQGGWLDVKVFQKYLRSLGLYENEELTAKAPEL